MKFRLNVTMLEDRWNPSDLLGTEGAPPTYDPSAPPAQQQPADPGTPAPSGGPTPILPPTPGYPGG